MALILSLSEAAKFLDCSARTVQRLIKSGNFPVPIQAQKSNYAGVSGEKRIWTEEQLIEIKESLRHPGRPKKMS